MSCPVFLRGSERDIVTVMSGVELTIESRKDSATSNHLITIALSAAGLGPLREVLGGLPADLPAAIMVLQHIGDASELPGILQGRTAMRVKFDEPDEPLRSGRVSVGPPRFHAVILPTPTIALSNAPAIRHARPSADWLLESAAASYRTCAVAVILSGRLSDGARGVVWMRKAGAHTIAQTPSSCGFSSMPLSAIRTGWVDGVSSPDQIAPALRVALRRDYSLAHVDAWEEPFAGTN